MFWVNTYPPTHTLHAVTHPHAHAPNTQKEKQSCTHTTCAYVLQEKLRQLEPLLLHWHSGRVTGMHVCTLCAHACMHAHSHSGTVRHPRVHGPSAYRRMHSRTHTYAFTLHFQQEKLMQQEGVHTTTLTNKHSSAHTPHTIVLQEKLRQQERLLLDLWTEENLQKVSAAGAARCWLSYLVGGRSVEQS